MHRCAASENRAAWSWRSDQKASEAFLLGGGRNAGCRMHDVDRRLTCGGAGHMREVRNVRIVRHRRLVTGAWKEDML